MYTIIIPSFNRIRTLLPLLLDISLQSLSAAQIYLVLQSYSPDKVANINDSLIALGLADRTSILEYDSPYGLANCRTLLLHRLSTPYFSFLDDDVSISDNFFELAISFHRANPDILACSGFLKSVTSYPLSSKILNWLLPYDDQRRRYFSRLNSHSEASDFSYTDIISGGLTVWKTSCVQLALPVPATYARHHYFEDVFWSLYFRRANPLMSYAILAFLPADHFGHLQDRQPLARSLSLASELSAIIRYFYPALIFIIPLVYVFYFLSCALDFIGRFVGLAL